ncbi:MAG: molybdenum cofactor synthesis domain-containing protein [Bradymonadia bacterium]
MTLSIAIVTISDTRTAKTDESGQLLQNYAEQSGHTVLDRMFVVDEVSEITGAVQRLIDDDRVDVVLTTGGTGITKRDVTPEAIKGLSTKHIPGFGELFRMLSYKEIGTSTIQSRADGWLCDTTLVFALPGSPNAIRLAWESILVHQLNSEFRPCNFVQLKDRF